MVCGMTFLRHVVNILTTSYAKTSVFENLSIYLSMYISFLI